MQFSKIFATALMGTIATAQMVHVVSVGSSEEGAGLTFSPNAVTAAVGDMVQFQFRAGNHTITQSTFDTPCAPMPAGSGNSTAGVYSGFMPVAASEAMGMIPTYTIMVANTNPMWFYCSQGRHCQNGMVMVINENTAANSTRSLANYMTMAAAANANLPGDDANTDNGNTGSVDAGDAAGDTESINAAAGVTVPSTLIALGAAAALLL